MKVEEREGNRIWEDLTTSLSFSPFLAEPTACGSSQARDQTHAIAAIQATAVTMLGS